MCKVVIRRVGSVFRTYSLPPQYGHRSVSYGKAMRGTDEAIKTGVDVR